MNISYLAIFYSSCVHTYTYMHIQYIYTGMQIYPKYIYKDLRFHPYSTMPLHVPLRPGAAAARLALPGCRHGGPGGSLTSSWPGGRGVCKPVTVTVEW